MSKSGSTKLFGGTEKALQPWGRLLPCAWFQSRVSADVDNVSYGPLGPEPGIRPSFSRAGIPLLKIDKSLCLTC